MDVIKTIWAANRRYRHLRRVSDAGTVHMQPLVYARLVEQVSRTVRIDGGPGDTTRAIPPTWRLFGMQVIVDMNLPPYVWRLCDNDHTLRYDCRQGMTLRQVLAYQLRGERP